MITATDDQIKKNCEAYAKKKYGEAKLKEWEKNHKEIWYIPILNADNSVSKLGIFKMVDRIIMGQAQDKLAQGFYVYVEYLMRETLLNDDEDGLFIIDDERAFLSAAPDFNKIVDGINTALVKR